MVVVTGANGFIGRAVCAHLGGAGTQVRGLVRTLDGTTAARAEFMPVGDLTALGERALRNARRQSFTWRRMRINEQATTRWRRCGGSMSTSRSALRAQPPTPAPGTVCSQVQSRSMAR